jgi:hypothetical protein
MWTGLRLIRSLGECEAGVRVFESNHASTLAQVDSGVLMALRKGAPEIFFWGYLSRLSFIQIDRFGSVAGSVLDGLLI